MSHSDGTYVPVIIDALSDEEAELHFLRWLAGLSHSPRGERDAVAGLQRAGYVTVGDDGRIAITAEGRLVASRKESDDA